MKKVRKPVFNVTEIIYACAASIRDTEKKERVEQAAEEIDKASQEYDISAEKHALSEFEIHDNVAGCITKKEMLKLYDQKFVQHNDIRPKYYDKIMVLTNGKCPFCDLGQVGNLDHFLSKSLFPTFALTPYNLVPICRDCNYEKRDQKFPSYEGTPFHPYYDESDDVIWLKANLIISNGGIVVSYYVDATM